VSLYLCLSTACFYLIVYTNLFPIEIFYIKELSVRPDCLENSVAEFPYNFHEDLLRSFFFLCFILSALHLSWYFLSISQKLFFRISVTNARIHMHALTRMYADNRGRGQRINSARQLAKAESRMIKDSQK